MINFPVLNRFTSDVQFTAEIDCAEDAPKPIKLGLAVNWGIENSANLAGADLAGAKWRNGIPLTRAPIHIFNTPNGWPVTILESHMQIGCEFHTHNEWAAFDDKRILKMAGKRALEFWCENKDWLLAACRVYAEADQ